MQVPYGQGLPFDFAQDRLIEPLVSRKLVYREVYSEGNETTKLGTEVHEPYTEAFLSG